MIITYNFVNLDCCFLVQLLHDVSINELLALRMSQINLGGMVGGGTSRLSGLSSGLDTQALIDESVEAKSLPIRKLEEQIEVDNKKAAAFSELNSLLSDLKSSVDKLRLNPTFGSSVDDVFAKKKIVASSSDNVGAEKYAVIATDEKAEIGSFTIEVVATAKEKIQQSKSLTSKTTGAVETLPLGNKFRAGTFQLNGVDITFADGDSLVEVASKINLESTNTNVKAQIIQPNSGEYRLVLQSTLTGVANDITITDGTNVMNGMFDYHVTDNPDNIIQAATDSQMRFNSFLVNRTTNKIDDFIDGISFTLLKETPGGVSVSVDIVDDKTAATNEIVNFVDKYNALMSFIETQQERDTNGKYLETAVIKNNSLLAQIKSEVLALVGGEPTGTTTLANLADIGVNFKDVGVILSDANGKMNLEINEEKFIDMLESSYDDIKKLFQYQYTSSSSKFIMLERSNNLTDTSITIDVDIGRSADQIAQITLDSGTINATFEPFDSLDLTQGGYIKGNEGTELYGYKFIYTGTGVESTTVTFTQGIGDKLYNQINNYLSKEYSTTVGGASFMASIVDLEIYNLKDNVETSHVEIDKKQQLIDKYKESLIKKYTALESAVAKANSIISMIDAQSKQGDKR